MAKSIVIVEDDKDIRENYIDLFTRQGYAVKGYADKQSAEKAFKGNLPDLVILDIGLDDEPDGGFDLCRQLRSESSLLPIIFLTARDADIDQVSGLRLGADDYLTKDISLHQLLARVSSLFRRVDAIRDNSSNDKTLEVAQLALNIDRLEAKWANKDLFLTVTEIWILNSLVQHPGHVKSRDQLMKAADTYVDGGTITSHIKRLRKKFLAVDSEFDLIESVYGAGYRWKVESF
jgi:two-component system OmpR family response regulator